MSQYFSIDLITEKLSLKGSFFGLLVLLSACGSPEIIDEESLSEEEKTEMVSSEIKAILIGKSGSFELEGETIITTDFLNKLYASGQPEWYDGKEY